MEAAKALTRGTAHQIRGSDLSDQCDLCDQWLKTRSVLPSQG